MDMPATLSYMILFARLAAILAAPLVSTTTVMSMFIRMGLRAWYAMIPSTPATATPATARPATAMIQITGAQTPALAEYAAQVQVAALATARAGLLTAHNMPR